MRDLKRLCVFCGSATGTDPRFAESARHVGRTLASRHIGIVYGGGAIGLMGEMADAAMAAGGEVIGVIPEGLFSVEVGHDDITELRLVATMHERKALMYELSDALIALPGGIGTLEELAESLTWVQIGLHDKPIGLLDTAGFYDQLVAFVDHQVATGFVKKRWRDRLIVDADLDRLVDRLASL